MLYMTGAAARFERLGVVVRGPAVTRGAGLIGDPQEKASPGRRLAVSVGRTVARLAPGSEHRMRRGHRSARVDAGTPERGVPDEPAAGDHRGHDGEDQLPAAERVRVGDAGVLGASVQRLPNDRLVSRSLDNRIGAFVVLEALRLLAQDRPRVAVLTSGPKPTNATELLESQLLIDFIEKALEEFDHVIFDSGPLLFVSESVALAPRVDGVVTVVRARANSRGLLQRMRDTLRQVKAEHIGVVLNAVRARGGGYYRSNIKTFYQYQNGD